MLALVLMAPAFYNGYPLVFADTGTYILSGMDVELPYDRPLMYGLFVNLSSLHYSLWLTVFFQCLIVSFTIKHTIRLFLGNGYRNSAVPLMAILVAFTSVGWYASQLMPDIFTSVCIMCILLLTFSQHLSSAQQLITAVIFMFSVNVHASHFLIAGLLMLLTVMFRKLYSDHRIKNKTRVILPIVLLVTSVVAGCSVNYAVGRSFTITRGSHVFLTGRMLDNGILKEFLDERCETHNYLLCDYKDSLPLDSRALLWDEKSPLNRHGGWAGSQEDYQILLRDLLSSPKYVFKFAFTSATAGISQLLQNDIGSGLGGTWYGSPYSPPYTQIARHFPQELKQYEQSRQNENLWSQKLDFENINFINNILIIASVLFLYAVLCIDKVKHLFSPELRIMVLVICAGITINAFVTAGLANVYDRLQSRVSWMFVFLFLVLIIRRWSALVNLIKHLCKQAWQQPNDQ